MKPEAKLPTSRRDFLRHVVVAAGTTTLGVPLAKASGTGEPASVSPAPQAYLCFGPDEASFVETLVNVLSPADELTPSGVDCGLACFIDRQLAGAYGKGERLYRRGPWRTGIPEDGYQLPLTPEQYFKAGLKDANEVCVRQFGRNFSELTPDEADAFLHALSAGKLSDAKIKLADWFNDLVYPLFVQGCFADPIYGGNRDKVFWKMIGYPGLPAVNGLNMVKYRGKPFPPAATPKSIEDFS